jgi:hypothetical protein
MAHSSLGLLYGGKLMTQLMDKKNGGWTKAPPFNLLTEQLADPEPISTYSEARLWLWRYSNPERWFTSSEPMPPEGKLVCDIFWVSPAKLRADLRKDWGLA